jgi:hypothetical protein
MDHFAVCPSPSFVRWRSLYFSLHVDVLWAADKVTTDRAQDLLHLYCPQAYACMIATVALELSRA